MGIVDLGRGIYIYNGVNQAARELARVTSVHLCDVNAATCTIGTSPETADVAGDPGEARPRTRRRGLDRRIRLHDGHRRRAVVRELPVATRSSGSP